jgi:exosome complex component RRP4
MTNDELRAKERDIVVPGEVLAEGMGFLPSKGTYRDDKAIRAGRLGMVALEGKVIKLIPLSGVYLPKVGDKVIGRIIDVLMTGWRIDLRGPYSAVLGLKDATAEFIPRSADLTQYYGLGDAVLCKIITVTSQRLVDVTMKGPGLRKLKGGRIIEISPNKVPRVVGKEGSMALMIKNATGCNIQIGQNGLIWIEGQPEAELVAVESIRKIEAEAHLPGLTERMKAFLEQKLGKPVEIPTGPAPEEPQEMEAPREHRDYRGGGYRERRPPRRGGFRRQGDS